MTCRAMGDRPAGSRVIKAQWCLADLLGMTG
jgi:hypothetical protein